MSVHLLFDYMRFEGLHSSWASEAAASTEATASTEAAASTATAEATATTVATTAAASAEAAHHATTGLTGAKEIQAIADAEHGIAGDRVVLGVATHHGVDGASEV